MPPNQLTQTQPVSPAISEGQEVEAGPLELVELKITKSLTEKR